MQIIFTLIILGFLLGPGLLAIIVAVKLWLTPKKPRTMIYVALAFSVIGPHILLLLGAQEYLPRPIQQEYRSLTIAALSVLALGLTPALLHFLMQSRGRIVDGLDRQGGATEESLADSLDYLLWLEKAYNSLPLPVVMTMTETGEIILVNDQAEFFSGWDRGDLKGRTVELLVPDYAKDSHPGYRKGYHKQPTVRVMGSARNLQVKMKDGTLRDVIILLGSFMSPAGMITQTVLLDREIVALEMRLSDEAKRPSDGQRA